MNKPSKVGGQAIIEGVMMRSPNSLAIAVRRNNGDIVVNERVWQPLWEKFKFLRWPFFRGAIVLLESLMNGMQALMFSADQAMIGIEEEERKKKEAQQKDNPDSQTVERSAENPDASDKPDSEASAISDEQLESEEQGMSKLMLVGTILFSLSFAFLVFKGVPHMLASVAGLSTDNASFHILDGAIKISMFIGYVFAISFMPDIKRVFQYHGAEHKAIYTFEAGEELTVENARKHTTLHPRCGTSFVIIVLLSSIFVFMVVFPFLPAFHPNKWINAIIQVAVKLPLMFPIAGVSYEFLKWSANHIDNPVVGLLIKPGLWLQKITTSEPDDDQLEIGLISLRKALWRENLGNNDLDSAELKVYKSAADIDF